MTVTSSRLFVTFGQIAIFDGALERPFNDWADAHFEQGFSWRPGSVSFLTLKEDGPFLIEILISEAVELSLDAIRIIETPFRVPENGSIEIASISDRVPLNVIPGLYELRYEAFPTLDNLEGKIRLVFARSQNPAFKILRADSGISAGEHLLLSASPA